MQIDRPFFQQLLLLLVLSGLLVSCKQAPDQAGLGTVTIDNINPRRDVAGNIIDAHDGCLQYFNGRFYLYGTAYGTNDGYNGNNHFQVYSSPDLGQWKLEGDLIRLPPDKAIFYRPYVIYNARTHKYVLWFNWYPLPMNFHDGREAVAVSDSPTGPFTLVTNKLHIPQSDSHPGDGSLFVDDDGTAYYIFNLLNYDFAVHIARLTPDYLGLTDDIAPANEVGAEAPMLFRRNNYYYLLCGELCSFCPEGSKVQYMIATSPMGPYTPKAFINPRPPKGVPFIPAQETWVARLPMGGQSLYIWMADRWGSTPDGLKGHDFQFWSAPLEFTTNGDILPIERVGSYDIHWSND